MWVVRPVKEDDLSALLSLAAALGTGMTTFPADRDALEKKILAAADSFSGKLSGANAQYLMVLEETKAHQILGVSAVYPSIGHPFGFFSYHVDRLVQHSPQIEFDLDCTILNLSNAYTGLTEVGTLAVSPGLRKSGAGKMLARARYKLMACFPELFADRVIAELRGWQETDGHSPFWAGVGQRFFQMDFPAADAISAIKGAEWIANIMPKFPIYADLLDEVARSCIGKAHATSAIAMAMLVEEGFRYENYVDVFDAGPQLIAPISQIKTVAESKCGKAQKGKMQDDFEYYLISNKKLDGFRMVRTKANINDSNIIVDSDIFGILGCNEDDVLRYVRN